MWRCKFCSIVVEAGSPHAGSGKCLQCGKENAMERVDLENKDISKDFDFGLGEDGF